METPIDWLDVCRRASARQAELFAATRTISERTVYEGRGEGGDNPPANPDADAYIRAFKAKYPDGNISQSRITNVVQMLAMAIDQAGSASDVVAVGKALEGMSWDDSLWGGNHTMRAKDHQIIQDVHIYGHEKVVAPFDFDNSGYGLKIESTVVNAGEAIPTTCEMERP